MQSKENRRAIVRGTVYDPNGAVIRDAEVVLTNEATHQSYTAETDEQGVYVITIPDTGVYPLKAKVNGFRTSETNVIAVKSGHEVKVNVMMELAVFGEFVPVQYQAPESLLLRVIRAPWKVLRKIFG